VLLTELLTPDRIKIPLVSRTKAELLRELVDVVAETSRVSDAGDLLRAVREREEVLSTGIGNGVAIPHGKSGAIADLALAAGVTREGIDFEALDGKPVNLFFMLIGPESAAGQHVKALSRISRLLRKDAIRNRLATAASADEFYAVLSEADLS